MDVDITADQLIAYSAILTMAVTPIWIGSHLSLKQKGVIIKNEKGEVVFTKEATKVESMSAEDAWKFPFVGSAVLFGLYVLFKVFSKEYINMLLTGYFLLFGIFAVSGTVKPIISRLLFGAEHLPTWKKYSWLPFWKKTDPWELEFDRADVVSVFVGAIVGVWYVSTKHWICNNVLGLSFSIQGITLLSLGSYKIGCILLGGLFFYDIFWVFGTDVMVTVAKSFDAPIKLLFPKQLFAETLQFSMLGLGDIVIPGIFIALLLRFDVHRAPKNQPNISKLYFIVCFIAYILGLGTTIFVMHVFKAAQPALLYLVPACLGCSLFTAVSRGEIQPLFEYNEEEKKPAATETKKE